MITNGARGPSLYAMATLDELVASGGEDALEKETINPQLLDTDHCVSSGIKSVEPVDPLSSATYWKLLHTACQSSRT